VLVSSSFTTKHWIDEDAILGGNRIVRIRRQHPKLCARLHTVPFKQLRHVCLAQSRALPLESSPRVHESCMPHLCQCPFRAARPPPRRFAPLLDVFPALVPPLPRRKLAQGLELVALATCWPIRSCDNCAQSGRVWPASCRCRGRGRACCGGCRDSTCGGVLLGDARDAGKQQRRAD